MVAYDYTLLYVPLRYWSIGPLKTPILLKHPLVVPMIAAGPVEQTMKDSSPKNNFCRNRKIHKFYRNI